MADEQPAKKAVLGRYKVLKGKVSQDGIYYRVDDVVEMPVDCAERTQAGMLEKTK